MADKAPDAFRSISEASEVLGVPQHVLRFWETRFAFISPMKRAGGRRLYRPADLAVLGAVRTLLHDRGYKIEGVQRLHKTQGLRGLLAAAGAEPAELEGVEVSDEALPSGARAGLEAALEQIEAARRGLQAALATAD